MPNYMTIPGFEDMTEQQVFDISAAHLLRQMVRSANGVCLYRSGKLACAAGVFLTDEGAKAADNLEDPDWYAVVEAGWAPPTNERLVLQLQGVHDYDDPSEWHEALRLLAKEHNLNDAVLG